MTPPLPPAIKACLAIERALEPLSEQDRADAIAMCFPPGTPTQVARLQMALEACNEVVRYCAAKGEFPSWIVRDIVGKALRP
jgi:hypothetical protein